jgi:hypothetical protein
MANKSKTNTHVKLTAPIIYANSFGTGFEDDDFIIDFNYISSANDSDNVETTNNTRIIMRKDTYTALAKSLAQALNDYKQEQGKSTKPKKKTSK